MALPDFLIIGAPKAMRTARGSGSGGASATRPPLRVDVRRALLASFADDIRLLEELTGADFGDWLGHEGRGEFSTRRVAPLAM